MSHRMRPVAVATSVLVVSMLAACGGSGDTNEAPTTPQTQLLAGMVMGNGPIKNAVVCLDLNGNAACDADEPSSAKTGIDGAYSITVDSEKFTPGQVAASSLIAPQMPGTADDGKTTVDMAGGTFPTSAYVLKQVPGKAGQINPLTTLVAAGVVNGMTEAVVRDNVVIQLGLASAAKIDDYQADAASNAASLPESARTAAQMVISALQDGAVLSVADQNAAVSAEQSSLRSLSYTDASNYNYSDFVVNAKAAGTPGRSLLDNRVSKVNGTASAATDVYRQAFLSNQGWVKCDVSVLLSSTSGSPNRTVFCGARVSYGYSVNTAVTGQSMADVVTQQQSATSGNIINASVSTTNLLSALGSAKFPDGSNLAVQKSLNVNQPLYINNVNTDVASASATTLEQFIAARPVANVKLPSGSGTLSLGLGAGNYKALRAAFTAATDAASGTVQYYECDLDSTQTTLSNCAATNTGTYTIQTVNGVRAIRFAGHAETVMTHTRLVAEVKASQQVTAFSAGDKVYTVREDKPGLTTANAVTSNRLNGTAWTAMKTQLGL